jgi:hypothetical protein
MASRRDHGGDRCRGVVSAGGGTRPGAPGWASVWSLSRSRTARRLAPGISLMYFAAVLATLTLVGAVAGPAWMASSGAGLGCFGKRVTCA